MRDSFNFTKSFQRTVAAYQKLSASKKADYERSARAAAAASASTKKSQPGEGGHND